MRILIEKEKESSFYFDGKFYDTGTPLDVSFSEAFRLGRIAKVITSWEDIPYDPEVFHGKRLFNFMGDVDMTSGFGGVSYALVKYSLPKYKVAVGGRFMDVKDGDLLAARNLPLDPSGAMIWHDQPRQNWDTSPFKKNVAIIPFETTRIPASWIPRVNRFDALFVPCQQNLEAFRDSGVKVPIEIIHWGIDPSRFPRVERTKDRPFTFGHMGALSERKGTDLLVEAFTEAFPVERDVKLICKTSYNHYKFGTKDKRIEIQAGPIPADELEQEFTKRIDCFVFPTRGEGFGLTPLEMMATGVPAIVTGWAGPLEYMTPEIGWLIDWKYVPATLFTENTYKEDCGNWTEPSKEHLIELMRYAYTHQEEVRQKGEAASKYVHENWRWDQKINMFHEALEKHL